uniref:Protein C10 n=1 Tax=Haemonchus placei TaxID=6290 RepID=A0A0N4X3B4_HAEPC
MDPATVLSMFKQLIEEQRNLASTMMKEQRDIIAKIMDRAPERDGAAKPEEQVTLPNVMAALSNRIEKFIFDPDADMSFSKCNLGGLFEATTKMIQ